MTTEQTTAAPPLREVMDTDLPPGSPNGKTAPAGDAPPADSDAGEGTGTRRKSAATRCLEMCAGLELWHTPDGDAYASLTQDSHRESWPLKSSGLRRWLRAEFFRVEGQALSGEALAEVIGVLDGQACFGKESGERPAPVRLAHHEGAIYLDLADTAWHQVRVTAQGWQIVASAESPVHFRRPRGLLALPEPRRGGALADLRPLLNLATDQGWRLAAGWLVGCFCPGPYPVLVFTGQQGTGKTTTGALLRAVLDPNKAPLRAAPATERDLAIAASGGHITAFDNLGALPDWLSDSLCRLSTGGGLGTRTLYEDAEETIFSYKRPCLITSIEDVISRGDLLDRCLLVELEPLTEAARRTEAAIWETMATRAPGILGGLLDVVSGALARLPTTHLERMPRMADFALWATAAEQALGWEPGAFMAAYSANRQDAHALALEGSPIITPLLKLLDTAQDGRWSGTASELLRALETCADDATKRRKDWPRASNALSGKIRRVLPDLGAAGIAHTEHKDAARGKVKVHTFSRSTPDPESGCKRSSPSSPSSPNGSAPEEDALKAGDDPAYQDRPRITKDRPLAGQDRPTSSQTAAPVSSGEAPNGDDGDDGDDLLPPLSDRPIEVTTPAPPDAPYTVIADAASMAAALPALHKAPLLALDTETTGLDPHRDRLRLLTLATPDRAYIVDTWRTPGWRSPIGRLLADPGHTILGHHLAFDLRFLLAAGIDVDAAGHDTMLAALLIDAGEHYQDKAHSFSLAAVAGRDLGAVLDKTEQTGDWSRDALTEDQLAYAARDAAILHPLHAHQQAQIAHWGLERVAAIEMGCLPAMAALAHAGMPFDADAWADLSDAALLEQQALEQQISAALTRELGADGLFGRVINLDSPTQIAKALAALGIQVDAANEEALVAIKDRHPVVPLLLRYRDAAKNAGAFGITWATKHVHPTTGRIHAQYRQIGSRAGRMSCTTPNMQQVPRSRAYRACFAAPPGHALVKADYSQIELRLAAVIAPDGRMLAAYRGGADLHRRTAAAVLGIPEDAVTKEHRQLAKALDFGLIFGLGAEGLAGQARTKFNVVLTHEEAKRYRDRFFATYVGLRTWHRRTGRIAEALDTRTLAGRRRARVADFTQKLNSPVQGSGADGLKLALARLRQHRHEAPTAQLVAAVHDELVAECPAEDAPAVAAWLARHMEAAMTAIVEGKVPIEVETRIARDWAGTPLEEHA